MDDGFRYITVLVLAMFAFTASSPAYSEEGSRQIAGLVEKVLIGKPGVEFQAKLDTGADISSIDAIDITAEERGGARWLNFTVVRVDNERFSLSGKFIRHSRVKRIGGATSRRPVVLLEVCLGSVARLTEVSLVDRKGFDYDVLVGRNFLNGHFMVDPARDHVLPLACSPQGSQ